MVSPFMPYLLASNGKCTYLPFVKRVFYFTLTVCPFMWMYELLEEYIRVVNSWFVSYDNDAKIKFLDTATVFCYNRKKVSRNVLDGLHF